MAASAILTLFFVSLITTEGRKHTLELKNDIRNYFQLSSFGFYEDGLLEVRVDNIEFLPFNKSTVFGFSLDRTCTDAISPYLQNHQDRCVLEDTRRDLETMSVIFFTLDLNSKKLKVSCSETMKNLLIEVIPSPTGATRTQRSVVYKKTDKLSDIYLIRRRRMVATSPGTIAETATGSITELVDPDKPSVSQGGANNVNTGAKNNGGSVTSEETKKPTVPASEQKDNRTDNNEASSIDDVDGLPNREQARRRQLGVPCGQVKSFPISLKKGGGYEFGFIVRIMDPEDEGLYNLYFHNCPNYRHPMSPEGLTAINLTVDIVEMNDDNYLSAGQIPLPTVYFFMSILFFLSGCFWIFILRKSSSADVYKIHYLMALLVYVKSFSLTFHGINFHFIQSSGFHIEGWAVLYYITHLLKGALLFITIVLIGTGWALIKHIVSDKEKKLFMIVIPLQVLANVAEIIMEESEEGDSSHNAWRDVFILVDLLCCGAILFPVVWSIRHLQEASQTDGKAAINLKKLKLFRHFYIMIVCYIYFTRIIVYLLKITVPFKYEWLDELFREVATLVFFVLTGYKFRPASNNPYLQLPQDDSEIEMEVVLTQSGVTDGVSKLGRNKIIESEKHVSKQESSHEYD